VTACAFGGADLGELYITTSRLEVPDGVDAAAGSLFGCAPGVRGQAVAAFAG
jgi:sugar lactone lactonase YvrE